MEKIFKILGLLALLGVLVIVSGYASLCVYDWLVVPLVKEVFNYNLPQLLLSQMIIINFCRTYFLYTSKKKEDKEVPTQIAESLLRFVIVIAIAKALSYLL